MDEETGLELPVDLGRPPVRLEAGARQGATLRGRLPNAKLWHFDAPRLYRLELTPSDGRDAHRIEDTFGVRTFEARGTELHLNGERVRLVEVERMAGSHPDIGMAEPGEWIEHDHRDLKALNCALTRVHWPQDRRGGVPNDSRARRGWRGSGSRHRPVPHHRPRSRHRKPAHADTVSHYVRRRQCGARATPPQAGAAGGGTTRPPGCGESGTSGRAHG